jgi:hypothetical protein
MPSYYVFPAVFFPLFLFLQSGVFLEVFSIVFVDFHDYAAVLPFSCVYSADPVCMQIASRGGAPDVNETFNVFVRRNAKENNFKAVLETIRDLMNTQCAVPEWLHDVFLGFGDPASAHPAAIGAQVCFCVWLVLGLSELLLRVFFWIFVCARCRYCLKRVGQFFSAS